MADTNFERTLRAAARRGRPVGAHPDAALLASYVDRSLSEAERTALEAHVADCPECMEHLALLGSVNVPDDVPLPRLEWSPGRLLTRWGWLVPVATVVLVVAVWLRQPPQPEPSVPAAPAPTNAAAQPASPGALQAPARGESDEASARNRVTTAAKTKPAESRRETAQAGAPVDALRERDKKQLDAPSAEPAQKIAAAQAPAPAPAAAAAPAPPAAMAGRADEAKDANVPKSALTTREAVAGAMLKSSAMAPVVIAKGPGVELRQRGTSLERSTDNGTTWTVELDPVGTTLAIGSCPTFTICWVGGASGTVFVRDVSGGWSRHVVEPGTAVAGLDATDAMSARARLADGRVFTTADGGVTWMPADQPPR